MNTEDAIRESVRALEPELVALRRELHRHPEIGLQLPATQQIVLQALDGLGLEITTGQSSTSVTAVLRGAPGGPAVLLRGDMDALPVSEETGLQFASTREGAMHACGHDLHTAMLIGAAKILAAHRDALEGDVVFMFQPGEEGFDGAQEMLDEGVIDASGQRVSSAYGMHVFATIKRGLFTSRSGPLMAASAELSVRVRGAGGHGSAPHRAKDPVSVAAQLVGDLETLVTRQFDVFDPVVLTVGSFHGGTDSSIIPEEATFVATVRTFSNDVQDQIGAASVQLCEGVAAAYGLTANVTFAKEYPATVNNAEHTQFAAALVRDTFGDERYEHMQFPQTGAEDFSRVLEEVPGCYLMLGAQINDSASAGVPDNHSPRVIFDERVIADGVLLHALLAIRALQRDATKV